MIFLIFHLSFQGCRDHTTGNYCDRCEEGFIGNATNGECISITNGDENFSCQCNEAGSLSTGEFFSHLFYCSAISNYECSNLYA